MPRRPSDAAPPASRPRLVEPRRAQLQQELGRVDRRRWRRRRAPGSISWPRRRAQPVDQRHQVGGVQRQHQHAEHVFPVEGRREQVAAEDHLLPDAAGDHDRVERQRLDHDRDASRRVALAGGEVAQHQAEADEEDDELHRREHALHQGPAARRRGAGVPRACRAAGARRRAAGPTCLHRHVLGAAR